jgi:hypothetical protein
MGNISHVPTHWRLWSGKLAELPTLCSQTIILRASVELPLKSMDVDVYVLAPRDDGLPQFQKLENRTSRRLHAALRLH